MTTINDNKKITEELEKLNELFAKRYTDEDEEYILTTQRSNTPPIVDDWPQERHTRRAQPFDNNNQRRYPSNNRQQNRNYSNDRRQYRDEPNDRRQYRDDSNNRQQHRNFSNHNRQHRDRSRSPIYNETRR